MTDGSTESRTWEAHKARLPFALCLVAEEIGTDLDRVISVARSMGIEEIELGSLWDDSIENVPFGRMVAARDALRDNGIRVRIIATQAFKTVSLASVDAHALPSDPHYREHMELFQTSIHAARFFGAPMVRAFSFRRDGMIGLGNPSPRPPEGGRLSDEIADRVAAGLRPAVEAAAKEGLTVALENVRSCWCNSGRNTRTIMERVDSEALSVIWDPANAYVCGEVDAATAGYEAVKPFVAHVHLKDAVVENDGTGLTRWERIGDGDVGLGRQLKALNNDAFDGCISLETHWAPPNSDRETNTRQTYEGLIDLLADV